MQVNKRVDDYINSLPDWQQKILITMRHLIHEAVPDINEEIKFTNRPYFTFKGNVCAFLAAKDHVNVFIYDPIAPDPKGIINQGHNNVSSRAIQIYPEEEVDHKAFKELIKAVADNNNKGGWRKLKASS